MDVIPTTFKFHCLALFSGYTLIHVEYLITFGGGTNFLPDLARSIRSRLKGMT
jgi:hypothetical protein